ncbi:MAG: MBL fold metallo-hydrolase [Planctomycetes bacterium]|nr:MBL fold metallo-hydrolase [Planctomycetota bacterium]
MKLHFLGANRQVTGSCYCLEANGLKIMVDRGMFHERPCLDRNWEPCPVPADQLAALVLTHVHVDHCGLIPRLVKEGFKGPIYCTPPSVELAEIVLRDSAHIQTEDARFKLKRHAKEGRQGKHPVVPLYVESDVERVLPYLRGVPYNTPLAIGESVSVTFHDAGHILGSAMPEFRVREREGERRVIFSGDIGQTKRPLIRDPSFFQQADYVVMETTYGDRDHPDSGDIASQLAAAINRTAARGGNVVIPTFAIERAQELVYYIGRLVRTGSIPRMDVFLDSPMAVDVTDIFRKHRDCLDEETWNLINSHEPPLRFPGLHLVRGTQESKAINEMKTPSIIMSSAGMCNAGRIKHHLRANITRPESTILFVGYQAQGTLGRQILDGHPIVRIHGREWKVRARIEQIDGFSGHADRSALMRWIGSLRKPPRRVFLTHGDEEASESFAAEMQAQLGWPVATPRYRDVVDLTAD